MGCVHQHQVVQGDLVHAFSAVRPSCLGSCPRMVLLTPLEICVYICVRGGVWLPITLIDLPQGLGESIVGTLFAWLSPLAAEMGRALTSFIAELPLWAKYVATRTTEVDNEIRFATVEIVRHPPDGLWEWLGMICSAFCPRFSWCNAYQCSPPGSSVFPS